MKLLRVAGRVANPSEELQIEAISKDPNVIKSMANPTVRAQLLAWKKGRVHSETPCEEVQLEIIKQDPHKIQNIQNVTPKVQMELVRQDARNLTLISHPTNEVILAAIDNIRPDKPVGVEFTYPFETDEQRIKLIRKYPGFIAFFDNPSEKLQMEAMKLDPKFYDDINGPTPRVQEMYGHHSRTL